MPEPVVAALRRSLLAGSDGSLIAWLAERRVASAAQIEPIDDQHLGEWSFTDDRMALVHRSGGFFSIIGVEVELDRGRGCERVSQPLIAQTERGLLGLLLRVVDERAQVLVQAKCEPGDARGAQLAPTVQATTSNYTRRHGGRLPLGLAQFFDAPAEARLFDADLPEQADLFLAKLNRNVIVLVDAAPELEAEPDFRWTTLAELGEALREPDTVNMSLRSVLSALAVECLAPTRSEPDSTWLAERRAIWSRRATEHRLDRLPGWRLHPFGLAPEDPEHPSGLRVVYVDVQAPRRELARWKQPMLTRDRLGHVELHLCRATDQPRVLLGATLGPGQTDGVRFGPATPTLSTSATRISFDAVLGEDGGRLLALRNRYVVFEHPQLFAPGPDQRWVPVSELPELLARGLLDIELRTCLTAAALGSRQ